MKEKDIIFRCKQALTFAARGGLARSLFIDSPEADADMLLQDVLKNTPVSQKPVVVRAVKEWRAAHGWLEMMPDRVPEDMK